MNGGSASALRRLRCGVWLVVVLAVLGAAPAGWAQAPSASAPGSTATTPARRVVLVALPGVTWDEIAAARPRLPNLTDLIRAGATANLSLRSTSGRPTAADSYLTVGAGNRAVAGDLGGAAFAPDEDVDGSTAAEVAARRQAHRVDGAVVHAAWPSVLAANREFDYGAQPGALGAALRGAGLRAAAIGNADGPRLDAAARLSVVSPAPLSVPQLSAELPPTPPYPAAERSVALSVADTDGSVALGSVSPELLRADAAAPYGVRLDPDRVTAAAADAVAADARVVAVEASDLSRQLRAAPQTAPSAVAIARARALADADALLGRLRQAIPGDDVRWIVYSPVSPTLRQQLVLFAEAGAGVPVGTATSASTRRAAVITVPDLGPTVLDALGVARPASMTGRPVSVEPGAVATADALAADNVRAQAGDRMKGPALTALVVALGVVYLAVGIVMWRRGVQRWFAFAGLWTSAVPLGMLLIGFVPYERAGAAAPLAGAAAMLVAATLVAVACVPLRRVAELAPIAGTMAATLIAFGLDVVTGSWLQYNTPLGYSPIVAGRFTGIGNLGYSVMIAAAIVLIWIVSVTWGRGAKPTATIALLAAGFLLVDGAPQWGADVGGVLAGVPSLIVAWLLCSGRRIRIRTLAVAGVAMGAIIAVFAAYDLAQPAAQQTHLARLVQSVASGGGGAFTTVITRKLAANVQILTMSGFAVLVPISIAFLAVLVWRAPGLGAVVRTWPSLGRMLIAQLVAALLGMAVNDSGIAIPATMLAIVTPVLLYVRAVADSMPPDATVRNDASTNDAAEPAPPATDAAADPDMVLDVAAAATPSAPDADGV